MTIGSKRRASVTVMESGVTTNRIGTGVDYKNDSLKLLGLSKDFIEKNWG